MSLDQMRRSTPVCPRCGAIIPSTRKLEDGSGRYECPHCDGIWSPSEVFPADV